MLKETRALHEGDLAAGHGEVLLPTALARKLGKRLKPLNGSMFSLLHVWPWIIRLESFAGIISIKPACKKLSTSLQGHGLDSRLRGNDGLL